MSARERGLVTAAAVVLLSALVYQFIIKPRAETTDLVPPANEIGEAQAVLGRAALIIEAYDGLSAAVAVGERMFPTQERADQGALALLTLVERTAAAAGVTLTSRRITAPTREGDLVKATVEVAGRGDAAAVPRFLLGLRDAPVILDLERMELIVDSGRLQLRVAISTLLPRAGGEEE